MKLKRLACIAAFAAALALPVFPAVPASSLYSEAELSAAGFEKQASNEELSLWFSKDAAILAVRVASSGYVWYSSPLDWENDDKASGFVKNTIPSLLSVRAKDAKSTIRSMNSYVNVVGRGGLRVSKIPGGIRLLHNFKREGIVIPLDVTLDGKSLLMSIPVGEITEDDTTESQLKVLDIRVSPYFGASPEGEDGFILVPDGSGAVIRFDNNRSSQTYQQYVYGRDLSIVSARKRDETEPVSLPVYGLSREGAGFITVFEEGAARGVIRAETSGQLSEYNAAGATFIVRDFDAVTFRERTGTPRDIRIFEKLAPEDSQDVYSIRTIFLDEDDNDLAGMAAAYRTYLQGTGSFPVAKTDADSALVLNFIGTSLKKQTVAGIPVNVSIPYTTFDDVRETVERLKASGVENFVVKLDGWTKEGILAGYPDAHASSKLGGTSALRRLVAYLDGQGIPFYAGADFVDLYKTDVTHIKELTVNHEMNRSAVKIPDYQMSTFTDEKSSDAYPYYILRSSKVVSDVRSFMRKFDRTYASVGLAPDSLGSVLSSDFGTNGTSRVQTAKTFASLLSELSEGHRILLSRPFDYALGSTSYAADLPVSSSRYDIENESVPFYQMVLHGYIPFSNVPANRSTALADYKLKLLECGADVSFLWIANHPDYTRDSRMQWFMDVYRDDWMDAAVELYKEVAPVTQKVRGCAITDYTVDGMVRTTTFENGVSVTVNYADKTWTVTEGSVQ